MVKILTFFTSAAVASLAFWYGWWLMWLVVVYVLGDRSHVPVMMRVAWVGGSAGLVGGVCLIPGVYVLLRPCRTRFATILVAICLTWIVAGAALSNSVHPATLAASLTVASVVVSLLVYAISLSARTSSQGKSV